MEILNRPERMTPRTLIANGSFVAPACFRFARISRAGWICLLLLGLNLFFSYFANAQQVSKEYQLKAAFLYNFTKFIDWPTNRFADAEAPIVIGVLGANPFGGELAKAVEGRTQAGRTFVVTNLSSAAASTNVHLLFVTPAAESQIVDHLSDLHQAGVLTVGETKGFAASGGIITFTTEADRIRFEINLTEAEHGNIRISSKLLQLAKTVRRKSTPAPDP